MAILLQEGETNYEDEICELHAESEMSIEELLASLPKELLMPDQSEEEEIMAVVNSAVKDGSLTYDEGSSKEVLMPGQSEEEEEMMAVINSAVKDGSLTYDEGSSIAGNVATEDDWDCGADPEGAEEDVHTAKEPVELETKENHGEEMRSLMEDGKHSI